MDVPSVSLLSPRGEAHDDLIERLLQEEQQEGEPRPSSHPSTPPAASISEDQHQTQNEAAEEHHEVTAAEIQDLLDSFDSTAEGKALFDAAMGLGGAGEIVASPEMIMTDSQHPESGQEQEIAEAQGNTDGYTNNQQTSDGTHDMDGLMGLDQEMIDDVLRQVGMQHQDFELPEIPAELQAEVDSVFNTGYHTPVVGGSGSVKTRTGFNFHGLEVQDFAPENRSPEEGESHDAGLEEQKDASDMNQHTQDESAGTGDASMEFQAQDGQHAQEDFSDFQISEITGLNHHSPVELHHKTTNTVETHTSSTEKNEFHMDGFRVDSSADEHHTTHDVHQSLEKDVGHHSAAVITDHQSPAMTGEQPVAPATSETHISEAPTEVVHQSLPSEQTSPAVATEQEILPSENVIVTHHSPVSAPEPETGAPVTETQEPAVTVPVEVESVNTTIPNQDPSIDNEPPAHAPSSATSVPALTSESSAQPIVAEAHVESQVEAPELAPVEPAGDQDDAEEDEELSIEELTEILRQAKEAGHEVDLQERMFRM